MDKLREILNECQETASWFNIEISSINQKNDFQDTPLHTVCTWGDIESVKTLLDAGADINSIGDQGATPIYNAIISENEDLVKYLLKHGASKKYKIFGNKSLYEYAQNTNLSKEIIELLK